MTLGIEAGAHTDCFFGESCKIGRTDECPPELARRKRRTGVEWGWLELRREFGGLRHYLDGKPIHCGWAIELQSVEWLTDDYGDYTAPANTGTTVRYEAQHCDGKLNVTLYVQVGGHEFACRWENWHRFRWPKGHRG